MKENTLYLIVANELGHGFDTDGTALVMRTEDARATSDGGGFDVTDGQQSWYVSPEEVEEVGAI